MTFSIKFKALVKRQGLAQTYIQLREMGMTRREFGTWMRLL